MSSSKSQVLQLIPSLQSHGDAVDPRLHKEFAQQSGTTLDSWWATIHKQIQVLQPNRMLFLSAARLTDSHSPTLPLAPAPSPRYSLWIVDVALLDAAEAKHQQISGVKAAVLVLPQGRETEWQFRSMTGCTEIANQHAFSRVIFVALARGQKFDGLDQVQLELMPLLRLLAPENLAGSMPIVSLGSDVGVRREVFRISSSSTSCAESASDITSVSAQGDIIIEDVLVGEQVHRRLIFEGTGLVQSEARLAVSASYLTMTAAQRKAKKKKQKAAAKKKAEEATSIECDVDGPNDDSEEHLAAAASSISLDVNIATPTSSPSSSLMQYNYLPCEYQHGILALMSLLSTPPASTVLIGLGGGSLAMFLHLAFQHPSIDSMQKLHVVELQPSVVECALRFFGFHARYNNNKERMVVHVEDGVEFTAAQQKHKHAQHDLFIVDVNNTDLGEGLSFPPPAFLSSKFLSQVKALLTEKGLFVFNLGCRNQLLREQILNDVRSVFPQVYVLKPDEAYVNYIIVARAKEEAQPISYEACAKQLQSFQQQSKQAAAFNWDADMVEECELMLKRLQSVELPSKTASSSPSSVQLHALFPQELLELDRKD